MAELDNTNLININANLERLFDGQASFKEDMTEVKGSVREMHLSLTGTGKPEEGLVFMVKQHHAKIHLSEVIKHKSFWYVIVTLFLALQIAGIGDPILRIIAPLVGAPVAP